MSALPLTSGTPTGMPSWAAIAAGMSAGLPVPDVALSMAPPVSVATIGCAAVPMLVAELSDKRSVRMEALAVCVMPPEVVVIDVGPLGLVIVPASCTGASELMVTPATVLLLKMIGIAKSAFTLMLSVR